MARAIRAAVLERPGSVVRIEDVTLDEPRDGELLVRMLASGVCHSDLHVRDGEWERPGPIVIGHEGAGVVEAVGPGVADPGAGIRAGGLVALAWTVPCGRCRSCRGGRTWECPDSPSYAHRMADGTSRLHRSGGQDLLSYCSIGTMAEAQVVSAVAAVPMPNGTPPEVAALIGCCVATGVGAVTKTVPVEPGSSVAVIGLGGVGLSAVMGAALAGASTIVAVDRNPAKLDLARDVGATVTVPAGDADATLAAIRDATGGGADVCVEAIGLTATIELAIASVPAGGTALLVGMTRFGARASFEVFPFVDGGRRIVGSNYGSAVPAVDFPRYARLFLEGRLPIDRLVTDRIGLDGVEAAFERMRRGDGVRSVIVF